MPTTNNSVFRALAEQEIKKSGYYDALTSDAFREIITKTVITEQGKTRAKYTWLDSKGGIVAEHQSADPQKDNLPKLGKVEIKNSRAEYLKDYNKKTRNYHLRFTERDKDIIDILDNCENIQGYIKELIRKDVREKNSKKQP